jgi:hypothetical protein
MYGHKLAQDFLNYLSVGAFVQGVRFYTPATQLLISNEADSMIGVNGLGCISLESPWTIYKDGNGSEPANLTRNDISKELDLLKTIIGQRLESFELFSNSHNMLLSFDNDYRLYMEADLDLLEPWMAGIFFDPHLQSCYLVPADLDSYVISAPTEVHEGAGTYPEFVKLKGGTV